MMMAIQSFLLGILVSGLILKLTGKRKNGEDRGESSKSIPGWSALAFGLAADLALVGAMWLTTRGNQSIEAFLWMLSIAGSFAAVICAWGSIKRGNKRWPALVGLIAGILPALFWIAFAGGHLFGPGD